MDVESDLRFQTSVPLLRVTRLAGPRINAHFPRPGRTTGEHREGGKILGRSPDETASSPQLNSRGSLLRQRAKITASHRGVKTSNPFTRHILATNPAEARAVPPFARSPGSNLGKACAGIQPTLVNSMLLSRLGREAPTPNAPSAQSFAPA